ncbi:MAG: ABC transporter permease [Thermoproteota archaeon]
MKITDVFSYAFSAIKLRKLRAGLTILGVVIGIAAIVALLSVSQGLQNSITDQLQTGLATDTLIVSTGSGLEASPGGGIGGGDTGFTLLISDTEKIDSIENVSISIPVIRKTCYIRSGEKELRRYVVGVDFRKYKEIYSKTFEAESGEIPLSPDDQNLVVGKRVADPGDNGTLFCSLGDEVEVVWINGTARPPENKTYSGNISGVLREIGGFSFTGPSDFNVYIPISQAQDFFGTDECDTIIVKLENKTDTENDYRMVIDSVSEAIKGEFDNQVSVTSSAAVLDVVSNVFSTVEIFLGGIAAISLLVAGIGIMNIMIVSLMERTREIGILKALGMKSGTVLQIFLSESIIVGVLGGILGIASGWVLANVVSTIFSGRGFMPQNSQAATGEMRINPVLTPTVCIGALAFGIVVSVIFGLYPAWKASKLKPVEALRQE